MALSCSRSAFKEQFPTWEEERPAYLFGEITVAEFKLGAPNPQKGAEFPRKGHHTALKQALP